MGWERRGNHSYYYRKERGGSRVRSVYVGNSETAGLLAQLDGIRRDEDQTERENRRRMRQNFDAQEKAIDAMCSMNDAVVEAMLIASGFHTHKRQWRRSWKCQAQPKP